MAKLKSTEARRLIQQLNRMDTKSMEYRDIKSVISQLMQQFKSKVFTVPPGQKLYRGVTYTSKPANISYLGAPPAELVNGFQRCNKPNSPMFYCSVDPVAVFFELGVKEGDVVYLSKWNVEKPDFWVNPIVSKLGEADLCPALDIVLTYFETVFAQPVHDTFSHRYKVTSAISELVASKELVGDIYGRKIGGLSFPSVAHPSKSENLVLYPDVVDEFLSLDSVEEIRVIKIDGDDIHIEYTDIANDFIDKQIVWLGRPRQWVVGSGETVEFTKEAHGWSAKDSQGNIVDPS